MAIEHVDNRDAQRGEQRGQEGIPTVTLRTALNRFDLPQRMLDDPAFHYEYKAIRVAGADNPEHIANLEANGWAPVLASEAPELVGSHGKIKPNAPVVRGGQQLFKRPIEIQIQVDKMHQTEAKKPLINQMKKIRRDVEEFNRLGGRAAGLTTSYENLFPSKG